MALTPLDIHNKEFRRKLFGGYDREAVDEFLNEIIREMEHLIRENGHLREQIENQNLKLDQYRNLEETINKTLVVAQETAEDIRSNARKEADLILQDARLQADKIIDAGQAKARRITEENADLMRVAHTLRTQLKSVLLSQIAAIDSIHDSFLQAASGRIAGEHPPEERVVRLPAADSASEAE